MAVKQAKARRRRKARGAAGRVTVRGRFRPGSRVELVEVADERVLRSEGGRVVAERVVGEDGTVVFDEAVVGGRYMVRGLVDGFWVEVRARGAAPGDESAVLAQPPVQPDPARRADGSLIVR